MVLATMSSQVWAADPALTSELEAIESQLEVALNDLPASAGTNCRRLLVPYYDVKTQQFFIFLEETFQNKSSNSSLTNIAIAKYREYKRDLELRVVKVQTEVSGYKTDDVSDFAQQFEAVEFCKELMDVYVETAKQQMITHIRATATSKQITKFAEKYQSINGRLHDLNFELAQLYAHYQTFSNKLPGYLSKCVGG